MCEDKSNLKKNKMGKQKKKQVIIKLCLLKQLYYFNIIYE